MTVSIVISLPVVLAIIAAVVIVILAILLKTGSLVGLIHVTHLVKALRGTGPRDIDAS